MSLEEKEKIDYEIQEKQNTFNKELLVDSFNFGQPINGIALVALDLSIQKCAKIKSNLPNRL